MYMSYSYIGSVGQVSFNVKKFCEAVVICIAIFTIYQIFAFMFELCNAHLYELCPSHYNILSYCKQWFKFFV